MALINTGNIALQSQGFNALPFLRQIGLMVGLAASVAIGVWVVMWAQEPSYRVLYGSLSETDTAAVSSELAKSNIPYKVSDANGSIMVSATDLHNARLKLAAVGLPNSSHSGYEILDKEQGFGTSQFMENARYQRAIEGELARTIGAMNNVQTARVHLAVPKQSAFLRNRKKTSASVFVHLHPGQQIQEGQAGAIVHMVASSVPNLDIENVTLVDQRGRLLSNGGAQDTLLSSTQFDHRRKIENHYMQRIEDILTPILGLGSVKAQVIAELDFTFREETAETYNPEGAAIRSEVVSEDEVRDGSNEVGGVPGALSNQPPVSPVGAEEGSSRLNLSRRSTRNFELDHTISRTRQASGTVQKLSAAVVLNDRQSYGEEGEVTNTPLTDEEIQRFTLLVQEAIGFDAERGDRVSVINASFAVPEPLVELEAPPIWEQAWFAGTLKQIAAGIGVLILIFGVLKPILKDLVNKSTSTVTNAIALADGSGAQLAVDENGEPIAAPAGLPPGAMPPAVMGADGVAMLPTGNAAYDTHLQQARMMVGEDPKVVAQVVRNWVTTDGK
ncbi:MAG: flagellar M-ring protein FliF [Thiotrichales bacterium]|nr:flagellar M-ring protein FliF [Thiotrichales bacterium]